MEQKNPESYFKLKAEGWRKLTGGRSSSLKSGVLEQILKKSEAVVVSQKLKGGRKNRSAEMGTG